jgi:predicted DNA-binding protein YlxM (UPF0122 family)/G:T-mismatch repair DNA endonuclease (very short patch repair protein)
MSISDLTKYAFYVMVFSRMIRTEVIIPKEQLSDMYLEQGMSSPDIGKAFNCSRQTIVNKLRRYGIPVRNRIASLKMPRTGTKRKRCCHEKRQEKGMTKEQLSNMYWKKGISLRDIGKAFSCTGQSIKNRLREYGIPVRNSKDAQNMPLYRAKSVKINKAKWANLEYRTRVSSSMARVHRDPIVRAKHSQRVKQMWANYIPEERDAHIQAIHKANYKKPTKPELQLANLLDTVFPNEWRYVGNGEIIIGGKNPDFINVNGKKQIIEVFGDWWHGEKKTGMSNKEVVESRIQSFAEYGFDTLVIWQRELKQPKKVLAKISKFL